MGLWGDKMGRSVALDVLKGWGILFIVLGHIVGAGSHLATGATQAFCDDGYKYFYAFHVPLFFVAAGMTFRQRPWGEYLRGRFFRLLVPYFVFGVVSILLYALLQGLSTALLTGYDTTGYYVRKTEALPWGRALLNLLLGGWWPLGFAANSVLWFIPALFSVELIAQAFARVFRGNGKAWGGLAVVLWGIDCLVPMPRLPWGLSLVPEYLPYFVVGSLIGLAEWPGRQAVRRWAGVGLIVAFGILAVLNPWQYFPKTVVQYALTVVLALGNVAGWWLLSQAMPLRWVAYCGASSLAVMLMHKFPVLFLQNACNPVRSLFAGGIGEALLGVALVFVFAVGCCLLAGCLLLRHFPWALGARGPSGAGAEGRME